MPHLQKLQCDIYEANKTLYTVTDGGGMELALRAYTWKNMTMGPAVERKGLLQKARPSESAGFPASYTSVEC